MLQYYPISIWVLETEKIIQEMYNMSLKDFSNYILIDYSQFFWSIFNRSFVKWSQYMNWDEKDWRLWMVELAIWTSLPRAWTSSAVSNFRTAGLPGKTEVV